jgi:hypothetical protein
MLIPNRTEKIVYYPSSLGPSSDLEYPLQGIPLPVGCWPLSGDATDHVSGGLIGSGSPVGTVAYTQGVVVNGQTRDVLDLAGGGYIRIGAAGASACANLPTSALTVSMWVTLRSLTASEWGGYMGCFQDNNLYEKGWVLGNLNDKFSFALHGVNTGQLTYLQDPDSFELNVWYHLTATYDGSVMTLYVNGAPKVQGTSQTGVIEYPLISTDQLVIGAYKDANEDFRHNGMIFDVVMWASALDAASIQELYNALSSTSICDTSVDVSIMCECCATSQSVSPISAPLSLTGPTPMVVSAIPRLLILNLNPFSLNSKS